jgi:hypothetical protein
MSKIHIYRFFYLLPDGQRLYHTGTGYVSNNLRDAKHYNVHDNLPEQTDVIKSNFESYWTRSESYRSNDCWKGYSLEQIKVQGERVSRREFRTLRQNIRYKGGHSYIE